MLDEAKEELERARFMSENLIEMYSDTNKSDAYKVYEWERCKKLADIELDYIVKADSRTDDVYKLLESLSDKLNKVDDRTEQDYKDSSIETEYKEKIMLLMEMMNKDQLRRLWFIGDAMASCKE